MHVGTEDNTEKLGMRGLTSTSKTDSHSKWQEATTSLTLPSALWPLKDRSTFSRNKAA